MWPLWKAGQRPLSCSARLLRKCKPPKDPKPCEASKPRKPKDAGRNCGAGEHGIPGPFRDMGIPPRCTKESALECARKIKELQRQWEAVAAAYGPEEGDESPKRKKTCPEQPPHGDEGSGLGTIALLLAGVSLVAAIIWYIVDQQKKEDEKKKEEEEKKKK